MAGTSAPSFELCWGTVDGAAPAVVVDAAATAGFSSVTLSPRDLCAPGADLPGLRTRLADAGVGLRVVDALLTWLPGAPDTVPQQLAALFAADARQCLEAAAALGAQELAVAPFLGGPAPPAAVRDAVAGLVELAGPYGVGVLLEFLPGTAVPDLAAASCAVRGTGARLIVDVWHLARTGGTPADVAALPAGSVGALQLCDHDGSTATAPMAQRLLPGEGRQPLRAIADAVEHVSPGTPVGVEVFSSRLRAMPPGDAARTAIAAAAASLR